MNDSKLFNSIHNCVPWQNSFEKPLQAYKFLEPKKSVERFMGDYAQTTKEIRAFYSKTIDTLLRTAL